jgi:hypothetical protein
MGFRFGQTRPPLQRRLDQPLQARRLPLDRRPPLDTDVSKKGVRGDRLGARPCSLQNEGADPTASINWCSRQAFVPTINDDSGVDWIHNVQARLYASAGVFTVVALKRD